MSETDTPKPRGRRRTVALVLAAIALALIAGLWLARKPIADDVIQRELARRGVPGRYTVERIGLRTQRLENVSLGDPAAPDLTAKWVEVDVVPTLGAPRVTEVRAHGVRLRGALVDGQLRLGVVDRLLPPPSGRPFRLPDLRVGVTDARLALATPAGPVDLRIDGDGNLSDGFAGDLAARAPALTAGGCDISGLAARTRVMVKGARPRVVGPLRVAALACGETRVADLSGKTDTTFTPALDGWRGFAQIASGAAATGGWNAGQLRGQIDFVGTPARTEGALRLAGLGVSGPQAAARRVELRGRYGIGRRAADRMPNEPASPAEPGWRFAGNLVARDLTLTGGLPRPGTAAGTPVEPLMRALDQVLREAERGVALRASVIAAQAGATGSLRVENAEVAGGGARLRFSGGEGVRLVWPGAGDWQVDGRLALTGPGLPQAIADLRQPRPGAPISGIARIAPYAAGGMRLALAPVRVDGGRFATRAELSGPLLGGRVDGLTLPLSGRIGGGGFVLNPECAPLGFERLELSGLRLRPARLRLCPDGPALVANGRVAGQLVAPRLAGTLGGSDIALAAAAARFRGTDFTIDNLAARLGSGDRVSRLEVARLSGSPGQGVGGRFAGAAGQIGKVPLLVSNGTGAWRLRSGVLTLGGALMLADEANPPRFNPLRSEHFALRLADNRIVATGTLAEPRTGARVTDVALRHDLSSGTGGATLDVAGLTFSEQLQPEAITRLSLGVIANVRGTVSGQGRIAWNPDAVSSDGDFRIRAPSLAAAFGPVTGLSGDIRFTDLLGLETAPGQVMTVESINPGVLVENGVVRYRLLPGMRIEVVSGVWPFAGGMLTLRPTVLDFGAEVPRRMTFDVAGLEAAQFVGKLEVKNLDATGSFDGTLPMVFDKDGGRIVEGSLVSRPGGGRLAYVGEVSNADLGIWGDIAFDALKSIAYRNMRIDLNGEIDGEMVSQIRFDGISRGTIEPVATGLIARIGGRLGSQLQRLPFRFNIRIRAPFRGLISTARSFYDPGYLVRDRLPAGFETDPAPVQPPASRNER